jgi:hypothetical protein
LLVRAIRPGPLQTLRTRQPCGLPYRPPVLLRRFPKPDFAAPEQARFRRRQPGVRRPDDRTVLEPRYRCRGRTAVDAVVTRQAQIADQCLHRRLQAVDDRNARRDPAAHRLKDIISRRRGRPRRRVGIVMLEVNRKFERRNPARRAWRNMMNKPWQAFQLSALFDCRSSFTPSAFRRTSRQPRRMSEVPSSEPIWTHGRA